MHYKNSHVVKWIVIAVLVACLHSLTLVLWLQVYRLDHKMHLINQTCVVFQLRPVPRPHLFTEFSARRCGLGTRLTNVIVYMFVV